jgi:hypothetical protein
MDCEERTDLFLATSPPENRQQENLHNEEKKRPDSPFFLWLETLFSDASTLKSTVLCSLFLTVQLRG